MAQLGAAAQAMGFSAEDDFDAIVEGNKVRGKTAFGEIFNRTYKIASSIFCSSAIEKGVGVVRLNAHGGIKIGDRRIELTAQFQQQAATVVGLGDIWP